MFLNEPAPALTLPRCHTCSQPIEEGQPLQTLSIGYLDEFENFVPRVAHIRPEDCSAQEWSNGPSGGLARA